MWSGEYDITMTNNDTGEHEPHVAGISLEFSDDRSKCTVHKGLKDKRYKTLLRQDTDIVPELPSMGTVAWCGELDLSDDPESVADHVAIDPEGYLQVGSVEDCCRSRFQAHDREVRQGSRFRNTFLTDAGESVVCGHEQVISADVAAGVERWPLGSD